ncbi:MAG: beta-galactosidase [bacterium]
MYVGVDYYPEHWAPERWETDARLMSEAGFNVVRLAEFAWVMMEPEEGKYEFGWLDDALAILKKYGISAILGTPTGSMPAWVARKYPETLATLPNGSQKIWGVRKQNCFTSGAFRMLSEKITLAMAEHFKNTPNVIGWQTDNEFGGDPCFCNSCRAEFQDWLRVKYQSLDELNRAWGTHFWGHTYGTWGEITLPESIGAYNPGLCLDWQRFVSWHNVRFQADQIKILRNTCKDQFVTHNLMGMYEEVDYYDLSRDLDFVSWDNYPVHGKPDAHRYTASAAADIMRGVKCKNFWIMEQTAGPPGWGEMGRNPRPGEIRSVAFQQVAHGADGMVWFRWRTCTAGREQYWHGLLGHDGIPARRYGEAAQTAKELHKITAELQGTTVKTDVAIIWDYDSLWALRIQPAFSKNRYADEVMRWYRALTDAGVSVDMIHPTADFSKYKAVFAPQQYILPDEIADKMNRYVQVGGVLVTGFRTGVKDATSLCYDRTLPGKLSDCLGIKIEEYESITWEEGYKCAGELTGEFTSISFCDWVKAAGATVLAAYNEPHMKNYAAATVNKFGSGTAFYVGTIAKEDGFYAKITGEVMKDAAISPMFVPGTGVEATIRAGAGKELLFLVNHGFDTREVDVPAGKIELLSGEITAEKLTLDSQGVAIIKLK